MSDELLARLAEQDRALRTQLETLQAERARVLAQIETERRAAQERELLSRPALVTVTHFNRWNSTLVVEATYRPDLVEVWRHIPGRVYRDAVNIIPATEWSRTERELQQLPSLTIEWDARARRLFEFVTNAPPMEIDFSGSELVVTEASADYANRHSLRAIPGTRAEWIGALDTYRYYVPFAEAWRVPPAIERIDGAVYTDAAAEIIFKSIEQRAAIDGIVQKLDSDFVTHVGGHALKPFQRVGVEAFDAMNGEVLCADDAGLGKTWEALAWTEHKRAANPAFKTLIVCKASNLAHWRRSVRTLADCEPHVCTTGRPDILDVNAIMLAPTSYILISYDTINSYRLLDADGKEFRKPPGVRRFRDLPPGSRAVWPWPEIFNLANLSALVCDEAHSFKNPDSQRAKAIFQLKRPSHVLCLTATPIRNRVEELGTLLRLIKPNLFRSHEDFKRAYTLNAKGKEPRNMEQLHEMMRTFYIRRRKQDVIADYPQINRIERWHDLSPTEQESYNEVLAGFYTQLAEFDPSSAGDRMRVMSLLAQITRLTQICAASKAREITPSIAQEIAEANPDTIGKRKVLIFSHFLGTAHKIAEVLGPEAVCTVEYSNGSFHSMNATERDALFERVRDNHSIKYIVTTEASNEGHNLEFCWWTIFNDPWWTAASHYQAECRCIRISTPHGIDSIYVKTETEIETMRFEILEAKLKLFNEVIENIEANRSIAESTGLELLAKLKSQMWSRGA